ncbi:MAG: hypothetical protein Ct9H300mP14_13060 [Gammaproteobacteria bacterium]|nr:MAG: hypothetical protein Ct9H300mP14_13060 [Gammaproteobacteria bacterium]
MYVDITQLDPQQIYITLTQTVIPRPIAWVLSENANGSLNLAPYSFFNAVSSEPPLVMISTGPLKPEGAQRIPVKILSNAGIFWFTSPVWLSWKT